MRRLLAPALAAVLLVGCGDSARPFDTADDLSREIGCDERVDTTTDGQRRNDFSSSRCVVENVPALVAVFEKDDTLDKFLEAARRDVSPTTVFLVVGDQWVVQTKSAALAEEIAEAIGGRVTTT